MWTRQWRLPGGRGGSPPWDVFKGHRRPFESHFKSIDQSDPYPVISSRREQPGGNVYPIKGSPHVSLPIADVIEALSVIDSIAQRSDKRIMGLRIHDRDTQSVKTGEALAALTGGGHPVHLARTADGWRVKKIEAWRSW